TFVLTVFANLTIAVPIGLLLAMLSYIRRISGLLEDQNIKPTNANVNEKDENHCPKIASITISGPLFFGIADRFESTLSQAIHQRPTVLILKMRHVALIDATGAANFKAFAEKFLAHDGKIFVTELYDEPME